MSLIFKCAYCNCEFNSEERRNTHSLFTHFKLIPRCSNDKLIKKSIKYEQRLRMQYLITKNKLRSFENRVELEDYKSKSEYQEIVWKKSRDHYKLISRLERIKLSASTKGIILDI